MELAHCEFVGRRQNVIALGPSGTGKTHVAHGLGLAACQKGLTVRFTTAAALVHEIIEATDERRLQRHQTDQFCAGIDMILTFGNLTNGYGYANVTIGLHPEWMQSPEYPNCHICKKRMRHIMEINGGAVGGNSEGVLYIFGCPAHPEKPQVVIQYR